MGRVIVTGPPGSGKTTLALRVLSILTERQETLAGFTTKEIRRGGRRTGFSVTGVGGRERIMARKGAPGPTVGRYGVDVGAFEDVALVEIPSGLEIGATLVVDEIGKMELLSERFRDLVPLIFEAPRILATVHDHRHPMTDELKRRPDVRVVRIGPRNREHLPELVTDWVLQD